MRQQLKAMRLAEEKRKFADLSRPDALVRIPGLSGRVAMGVATAVVGVAGETVVLEDDVGTWRTERRRVAVGV